MSRVLATLVSGDLWIVDRNFCTLDSSLVCWRGAAFVIRQHRLLPWQARTEMVFAGDSETGAVFEQSVQLIFNNTLKVTLRRIFVQLKQPTRDGESEIALLSNLPPAKANALQIAALYQKRWRIERLFQVLEQCFQSEINTLAYLRAALFGFVMALICYNLLAVAQAAMRSVHGADKIEAGISPYYLADEVRRVYKGTVAIAAEEWQPCPNAFDRREHQYHAVKYAESTLHFSDEIWVPWGIDQINRRSLTTNEVTAARMVMPRSRSKSSWSVVVLPSSTLPNFRIAP